jgi:hypothetical protein
MDAMLSTDERKRNITFCVSFVIEGHTLYRVLEEFVQFDFDEFYFERIVM